MARMKAEGHLICDANYVFDVEELKKNYIDSITRARCLQIL